MFGIDDVAAGAITLVTKVIDKIFPDPAAAANAKLELLKLQQEGEFKELDADLQIALAQAATNTAEANSTNPFASSWRPLIGYVCGASLAYNFIIYPLLTWALAIWGRAGVQAPPPVDVTALYPLMMGMLGLGAMRSFDKFKGVPK